MYKQFFYCEPKYVRVPRRTHLFFDFKNEYLGRDEMNL